MSRFLFAIWPLSGHVNPQIVLADALRARGHEVAFYTGRGAEALLASEGFCIFPFQHVSEERVEQIVVTLETQAPVGLLTPLRTARALQDWLIDTVPDQVADLESVLATWQPDVVVTETAMWGPSLVLWERTGVPVAISSTLMGCLIPGPDAPLLGLGLPPPRTKVGRVAARAIVRATDVLATGFRRRVDRVRAQFGLPPMGTSANAFMARLPLYLVPSVPSLDYNRRDLPPNVHYIGPSVWSKPSAAAASGWLDELPQNQPWVHVTEGTMHYQDPFILRAAARGLADRPVQVVMTSGPQRDLATLGLGTLASNVRVEQWVSHDDLLPHCAALVTTGGAGTVKAALKYGVPMVVIPTHWDKSDNAQRIVQAGAGLRIAPGRCTPARLRAAVGRVLREPSFRANARRLAHDLEAAPAPDYAAGLLERLAHSSGQVGIPPDGSVGDLALSVRQRGGLG
jgi:MGT family glycosyltransferase